MTEPITADATPQPEQPQGADTKATPAKAEAAPTTPAATPPAETQQGAEPGQAKGEEAKADSPPPVEYEVKLPDGVEADPELLGVLKTVAKDQKGAQALVDAYAKAQERAEAKATQAWESRREQIKSEWLAAWKSDPEIGGADTEANAKAADRALARFGSDAFRKLVADNHLNVNPEFVRFLVRAEKATGEDRIAGKSTASPTEEIRHPLARVYAEGPSAS